MSFLCLYVQESFYTIARGTFLYTGSTHSDIKPLQLSTHDV